MLRLILLAVIGAVVTAWVALLLSRDTVFLAIAIPGSIVTLWLFLAVKIGAGFRAREAYRAQVSPSFDETQLARASQEGRLAAARILAIAETGVGLAHSPVCRISLLVVPASGDPYQTSTDQLISVIEAPQVQPDEVVVVVEDVDVPGRVAIALSPPADVAKRAKKDARVHQISSAPSRAPAPPTLAVRGETGPALPLPTRLAALGAGAVLATIPLWF